MSVFDSVKEVIVEILDVPPEDIKHESKLVEDLEADSLDIVEMVMQLEDKFGLQIPESAFDDLKTVKDVVEYLEKRLAGKVEVDLDGKEKSGCHRYGCNQPGG
ncbi:MAG: acyl carrier protein [Syntrophomonadales bacterium]